MVRLIPALAALLVTACSPPPPQAAPPTAESTPEPTPEVTPAPPPERVAVVPRSVWAAGVDRAPSPAHTIEQIAIHHTAVVVSPDASGPSRANAHLRSHRGNGWGDLAYHFLVHGDGTVRQGRPVGEAGDTNTDYDPAGHLLITLEGNFEEQAPTPEQIESAARLVAWGSAEFGVAVDTVSGHRDHAATACPGQRLMDALPVLRGRAQALLERGVHLDWQDCVVAVDVGHSPGSPGATSARGVPEQTFNRRLALEVVARLERTDGVDRVVLLDPEDVGIPLEKRGPAAAAAEASVLLSIHHDSVQPHYLSTWTFDGEDRPYSDVFAGHSLFVPGSEEAASEELGRAIGAALKRRGLTPTKHHAEAIAGENRAWADEELGLYRFPELVILKGTTPARVLVEAGVILNRDEEARLSTAEGRDPLVDGIAAGVATYCAGLSGAEASVAADPAP